ncbi:CotS family spore coat protein [Clostridium sporogenes]|uniref:CotS family spore coat protein n=1 Tax=Clostridium sporogenes TaxID=1509 RepID=UPI0022387240|nr:CotS family spore coat protein [Clostridium sporogenes]MCW6111450.1 CotS family spore coat protein [Clostridium sporogenes]
MDKSEIINIVENNYDININSIEKIKNVYKIISDSNKAYAFKIIKYEFNHFLFIISCMKHLQCNNFSKIPKIIPNNKGLEYIKIGDFYGYITEWIDDSRQCNYSNPVEVMMAANKLGQLHEKSKNFYITEYMKPRIGWFKWPKTFETRKDEILDFKKRILNKNKKSEFDNFYMSILEDEIERADRSIKNLCETNYLNVMLKQIEDRCFCHHDYANHNILIDSENQIYIIDFDYCMLDTKLHDLASILIRVMKNGKWDLKSAELILNSYRKESYINKEYILIMAAFMEFPQDYWQIGIQYYWEKQPWSEEFFFSKLNRYYTDREERQEFIEKFRKINI